MGPAVGAHFIRNTRIPKSGNCGWVTKLSYIAAEPRVIIIHSYYPYKEQGTSGFWPPILHFFFLLGTGCISYIIKNRNHVYEERGKLRDEREVTHFVSAHLNFYALYFFCSECLLPIVSQKESRCKQRQVIFLAQFSSQTGPL